MLIRDLAETTGMRLKVLGEQSSVRAAADAFADRRLGLVIVCDGGERTTGVLSKSDLVRHLARAGRVEALVTEVMTRSIVSANPDDDLRATWQFMAGRRLQNLPLLDAVGRPVGTLDSRDALQAILRLEEDQEHALVNYIAGVGYR
jgi:CBS domain-containing protein